MNYKTLSLELLYSVSTCYCKCFIVRSDQLENALFNLLSKAFATPPPCGLYFPWQLATPIYITGEYHSLTRQKFFIFLRMTLGCLVKIKPIVS